MPVTDRRFNPPRTRRRGTLATALLIGAFASTSARAVDDADSGATSSAVTGIATAMDTNGPAATAAADAAEAAEAANSSDATPASNPTTSARPSTPSPKSGAQSGSRPLDLSPATLRKAIADAKEPEDDITIARGNVFGTGKLTGQARIDQSFRDADIPTCMTPEAFKFDPPHVGPVYFGGFLAAPFLFHAIVTGKCRD